MKWTEDLENTGHEYTSCGKDGSDNGFVSSSLLRALAWILTTAHERFKHLLDFWTFLHTRKK
jgi:hypothetical protein